jgi:predicted O-methyltransferase YrrM
VALGLLNKVNGYFQNSRLAEMFLVGGKPQYMGHWIDFMAACYGPWGRFADAIRTGQPVENSRERLDKEDDYTRQIIMAMHDYALGPGREVAQYLNLEGRRRLLDVGGGPGTYSMLLAQKYPRLEAVVFDFPPVVKIARELIAASNLGEHVTVQEGDYLTDDLGTGYNVVLLSNVLHQEDPETSKMLLRKAYKALVLGGLVVIQAAFLNAAKDGPLWPVLQSLQLLLLYEGGRNYSVDETVSMVLEIGFSKPQIKKMSLFNAHSLILASKGTS